MIFKEYFKARESEPELQLVDKTLCGYLRAEISVKNYKDPLRMFIKKEAAIKSKMISVLRELDGLKFSFGLIKDFSKDKKTIQGKFYSNQYATLSEDELNEFYSEAISAIETKIEKKNTREGSGWKIDICNMLYLNIAKYQPLKGSSYIPLSDF